MYGQAAIGIAATILVVSARTLQGISAGREFASATAMVSVSLQVRNAPAQRDPLVAALFGAPRWTKESI